MLGKKKMRSKPGRGREKKYVYFYLYDHQAHQRELQRGSYGQLTMSTLIASDLFPLENAERQLTANHSPLERKAAQPVAVKMN